MLHFIEPLKRLFQENEFFRYIILLGVIAFYYYHLLWW